MTKNYDFVDVLDHVQAALGEIRPLIYLLSNELERALDEGRGSVNEYGTITLSFQRESISTLKWLAEDIWFRVAKIDDHIVVVRNERVEAKRAEATS